MKALTLIFIAVLISFSGVGQDTIAVYTYGGVGDDVCRKILPMQDGYLLVGTTSSFGRGPTDVYLVRVNKAFEVMESKTIGSYDIDNVMDAIKVDERIFILGYTNTETIGEYTGVVWELDTALEEVNRQTIDLGSVTIPNHILWHNGRIYVTGNVIDGNEKTFITILNSSLAPQTKFFAKSEIGRVDSWLSTDKGILSAFVSFELTGDSTGYLAYFDELWNQKNTLELPDSVGVARDVSMMHESSYLLTGDKIDTAVAGWNRIASISKVSQDFSTIDWNNRYSFESFSADYYLNGVKGFELSNLNPLLIAKTNFEFYKGGLGILVTEYDSNGIYLPGKGSIYGYSKDDVIHDALIVSDTLIAVGYSNSYGNENNDFYLLSVARRSSDYDYHVFEYSDTLNRILSISEASLSQDRSTWSCLDLWLHGADFVELAKCQGQMVTLYDTSGRLVKEYEITAKFNAENIHSGVYILNVGIEQKKIFIDYR